MRFILSTLLVFELSAGVAAAQAAQAQLARGLTLKEARKLAEQVSPEIAAARATLRGAMGRVRQSGAFPNPVASYSHEQTSGDGVRNAQDIITLEQPLELAGQRGARRRTAEHLRAAAEARLQAAQAQVRFDVTRAYAQAVAGDQRAALTDQAAQSFTEAGRVGRERLAAGDMSGYEHRRIRLEAVRYAALAAEAKMIRANARRAVATLLSTPERIVQPDTLVLTDAFTPDSLPFTGDSLVALALIRRPELLAVERETEAARAEARLVRAERIPTPVLGGGYKHERAAGGISLDGFVAQVSVPIPLWDRRDGAVHAAEAELERRLAEVETLRRRTEREVLDAYESYQTLMTQLAALGDRLQEDARPGLRAAQAAYREGETSLLEWLDAVRAYQEAESSHASLAAEYLIQLGTLERIIGTTLF